VLTLSQNEKFPSTPYAALWPSPSTDTDRLVNNIPTLLRRKMSRFTRTTVKFVDSAPEIGSSSI